MAYIPRPGEKERDFLASGGVGGAGQGAASGAGPAPAPSSGGSFGAVRGFFAANKGGNEGLAEGLTADVEKYGSEAESKAKEASETPENFGGDRLASEAAVAADRARSVLDATGTTSGIEALLGENRDATYTPGMRSIDAALLKNSPGLTSARERWGGTLSALNPTPGAVLSRADPMDPRPADAPYGNPAEFYASIMHNDLIPDWYKQQVLRAYSEAYGKNLQSQQEWDAESARRDEQNRLYDEWASKAGG